MRTRRWLGAFTLPGLVSVCVAGCAASATGGASPTTAEPAAESAREPASIEEAQAQLARARADLGGWVAPDGKSRLDSTSKEPAEERKLEQPTSPATGDFRDAAGGCATACRAMGSMKRAVDAICRMAGEADPRCTEARKTLTDSAGRVVGCGC
ncbi:MAG TPA: hypothetical protein VIF09_09020 [Polyangiaceae bacterium]